VRHEKIAGDLAEVFEELSRPIFTVAEASRHSRPANEAIEQSPCVAAGLRHGKGDLRLPVRFLRA
jgi:hypothetical protein